jgi:hypothetical protein
MTDTENEQLFDVLIPPGVPQKLIIEIPKKFNVKVVERMEPLKFANMDGDKRELLAFRGKLDEIKKVEKYMIAQLEAFVGEK